MRAAIKAGLRGVDNSASSVAGSLLGSRAGPASVVAVRERESRTRYIVLGVLSRNAATGYQIQKAIKETTAFFWSESYGQLYPTLAKLTQERLLHRKAVRGSRRREQLYTVTEEGLAALRKWLARPYHPTVERNEFLLKLFFGSIDRPEVTAGHVRRALAEGKEFIGILEAARTGLAARITDRVQRVFIDATIRYGMLVARAHVEWCEETLRELTALSARPGELSK